MLRTPPHILVTTPESLYLLLTAERSREMLRTVRTVIVDEIHAVIGTRRGAHLALVARAAAAGRRAAAAAARPLGDAEADRGGRALPRRHAGRRRARDCAIVDEGHRRAMDLGARDAALAARSGDVARGLGGVLRPADELIEAAPTTLVFVNTRRMAERVARHLSERLGDDAVTAHHGSLSKEKRLDAETRLKSGQLKALVATASLELGIDIGHVDLVCQIGSPHRIATLLQRVGRSGHTVAGTAEGPAVPDLARRPGRMRGAAARGPARRARSRSSSHDAPLDVLAQQIVAEIGVPRLRARTSCSRWSRRAWPYRDLTRDGLRRRRRR